MTAFRKPPVRPPHDNRADFSEDLLDKLVYEKGRDVMHERAMRCPCKTKAAAGHLATCMNCGSTGWLFVESVKTRMVVQSLRAAYKVRDWTEQMVGSVNITSRQMDELSFMDRVTLVGSRVIHKQLIYPFQDGGSVVGRMVYPVKSVRSLKLYVSETQPLRTLESSEYRVDGMYIYFDASLWVDQMTITAMYECEMQYLIEDVSHDSREFFVGYFEKNKQFPLAAVARRAHYILDDQGLSGTRIYKN